MRYKLFFSLVLSSTLLFSCNISGILDSSSQKSDFSEELYSDNILLSVEITGGIAGIYNRLVIEKNGIASFEDRARRSGKWKSQLSMAELADLDSMMSENDFFDLSEEYIDPQVADAFLYSIYYKSDTDSNLVNTDNFAAPDNLKNIIAELNKLVEKVKNNGLDFTLELSKTSFQIGDSVKFKFVFQNISSGELTLRFFDGQIFDFSVYAADSTPENKKLIWNWAADKAFTAALWQMNLQPGEVQQFEVTWNGKNNNKNFVSGEFITQAKLVSIPGGYSNFKNLQVRE